MSAQPASSRWDDLQDAIDTAPANVRVGVTAIDLDVGSNFSVRGDDPFMSASTIKTLILAALARQVDTGAIALDTQITLSAHRKVGGSGVLNWLTTGNQMPLTDYAWLMMAISDNTASNICIDVATMSAIRETAASLNLHTLSLGRFFVGRSPATGEPDNMASANDLAALMGAIETGTVASPASTAWMRRLLGDQQHLNRLPRQLPQNVTYAGKTGSLAEVHHDSGILTGPRGRVAIAVLTEGFPNDLVADDYIATLGAAAGETIA